MINQNYNEIINGRTEKSTTIITSVDINRENPDTEYLLNKEMQNKIIYSITLILLIITLMNIYAW